MERNRSVFVQYGLSTWVPNHAESWAVDKKDPNRRFCMICGKVERKGADGHWVPTGEVEGCD